MYKVVRRAVLCERGVKNGGFVANIFAISTKNYNGYSDQLLHGNRKGRIADYYAGKSVFITGATGFLGKVLIEKLLCTCSDIGSVYVLIRQKNGQSTQERLHQLLDVPLFDKLKKEKPDSLNKIIPIEGDIAKTELSLKQEDRQTLMDNVSIVIHSAAIVKFTESITTMISHNLEGTRKVMDLSKKIKNLETFVYLSTAFANSNRLVIEEKIYPPPKDLNEVYSFLSKHADNKEEIDKFTFVYLSTAFANSNRLVIEEKIYPPPKDLNEVYSFLSKHADNKEEIDKFVEGLQNTYSFSKGLCETVVNEEHGDLPMVMIRPSMVTPALGGSLPGWCDSWVAATALYSDISRGLTKVMYGRKDVICDMIPVDYVCNLTIVAAARGNTSKDMLIYNICSSTTNPITWKTMCDLYLEEGLKRGRSTLKPRKVAVTSSPTVVSLLTFTRQTVPAFIADVWLRMKGEEPRHIKMQKRAILLRDLTQEVCLTSWQIQSTRSQRLIATMSEQDKVQFPCDPKTINWKSYAATFYEGVNKYLLK